MVNHITNILEIIDKLSAIGEELNAYLQVIIMLTSTVIWYPEAGPGETYIYKEYKHISSITEMNF